ncbi:MAG: PAT family beta-lactamase induction signal transducer AmpG [Rhodothermales bacterium]|jgi:PAT family beta-lactamase induction signal transducer AmpG
MTDSTTGPDATKTNSRSPWMWIPSLYLAEGLPYVIVMTVSVIMYKNLDLSNTEVALYTSWLYLPWMIKPLWSPFVDLVRTKRFWVVSMQLLIGAGLAGVALTLPTDNFLQYSLAFMWLLAFSSATHDIAADGFYMIGLSQHDQAWFVGIRSTFYRLAMITGQGLLVMLAGYLEVSTGDVPLAWSLVFYLLAAVFVGFAAWHFVAMPRPAADAPTGLTSVREVYSGFVETFASFFRKPGIGLILAFLLLYRFGEAQLVKMAAPFLLDGAEVGGLGLSTGEVGFVYGTVGIAALTLGGILGGLAAARSGLKAWLWLMVAAINLPNAVYIILSYTLPESFLAVNVAVAIEQFGYGFGFTAYMLYMIYIADGPQKTAHFAICTGFMAAGMMLPGMASGWIQEAVGYQWFFVWVLIATIPGFIVAGLIPLDAGFGRTEPKP